MSAGAAAAAAAQNNARRNQVVPRPPQLRNDEGMASSAQEEAMRQAELDAPDEDPEAKRTMGRYVDRNEGQKMGKITKKKWHIIDPRTSKIVPYWDGVGMSALIFTAIVTFVEVAFVTPPGYVDGLFIINRCVDVIFILDMILQFFLMYPTEPKSATETVRWVHDPDKIAKKYLKSWFPIDALSICVSGFDFLSIDSITGTSSSDDEEGGNVSTLRVLRIVRVARLIKLVRLVRSSRIMKRFESRTAINYGHLALFKCLVFLLVAGHWYACIWGLMTTFEAEEYNKCWYVEFGYCVFTPKDGGLLERQLNADPSNATLIEAYTSQISLQKHYTCTDPTARYVASLYWAIMTITSIGYGDIAAVAGNTMEQAVCTFLMLLGGMIWGFVIATFCGVVANLDPAGTEFRTTMDNLNRFMALQGLPNDMRRTLREYFHQTRHLQIARANRLLIENMSPMLQGMVVWKVNEKWLRHVWFLAKAEDSFMVELSLALQPAVFAPGELCPHGQMYIIHRGIALYGGKVLTSGKVWGEDIILSSPHLRSKYAARCMTYVEVYLISRDDLIAIAIKHPATLKQVRRSAFRLGFRREMIRKATESLKRKASARGETVFESKADAMLVSISSQKQDDEQKREAEQQQAAIEAAMDSGAEPLAASGALPPLAGSGKASPTTLRTYGATGGASDADVSALLAMLTKLDGRLAQQHEQHTTQIDALTAKVTALADKVAASGSVGGG